MDCSLEDKAIPPERIIIWVSDTLTTVVCTGGEANKHQREVVKQLNTVPVPYYQHLPVTLLSLRLLLSYRIILPGCLVCTVRVGCICHYYIIMRSIELLLLLRRYA